MHNDKIRTVRIIIFLIVLCLLAVVIQISYSRIEFTTELEKQSALREIAKQNVLVLENTIDDKYSVLLGIANLIQADFEESVKGLTTTVNSLVDLYHLKRMGYINSEGGATTTDGYTADLSSSDNFLMGMQGKASISCMIEDFIGESEKINVFSVPVNDKNGTVKGVLFAAYRTEELRKLLTVGLFDGRGYCCVVKQNGDIVVDSETNDSVEELKRMIHQGEAEENGSFVHGKEEYFYICMPVDVPLEEKTWYLFTVVPSGELTKEVTPLIREMNGLLLIFVLVMLLVFGFYIYLYQENQKELKRIAYEDILTKGDNYAGFKKKLKEIKNRAGYIISMDFSDFVIINNTCGIEKGNETIRCVWKILVENLRVGEHAAHVNADKFIMFIKEENRELLRERMEQVIRGIEILQEQINIPHVKAYFGVYHIAEMEEVDTAYSYAIQAKNMVKGRNGVQYCFYDEADFKKVIENKELEDAFEDAVKNEEFEVWYQPKYDTKNSLVVGAEALVRWRRKDDLLISPGKFIPLFEKNGMISTLDEYVFEKVCIQQKKWRDEGKKIVPVSINISRASLYYLNIVKKYKQIQQKYGVASKYLQFEITESATVENDAIENLISEFHEAGFKLLLDDFGAGYSSISTLNTMHFDVMKVDKSLIDYIGDKKGEKILHYTIRLAQSLGLKITAEGVEEKKQVQFLKDLNCDDIQGYYFSKPLSSMQYEKLL